MLYAGLAVVSLVLGVYLLTTDPPEDGPLSGLDVEAMAEDNPALDADALGGDEESPRNANIADDGSRDRPAPDDADADADDDTREDRG